MISPIHQHLNACEPTIKLIGVAEITDENSNQTSQIVTVLVAANIGLRHRICSSHDRFAVKAGIAHLKSDMQVGGFAMDGVPRSVLKQDLASL